MLLECFWCNKEFEKLKAEYDRQVREGRDYFFCSRTCNTHYRNIKVGHINRKLEKQCPECGKLFMSNTGKKAATFCSRSCASSGSVSEYRSNKARETGLKNIQSLAKAIRQREAWRYVKLNTYLNHIRVPHEFEYVLGSYIFDLALIEHDILIEFDEPYHNGTVQSTNDLEKDRYAEDNKWIVVRVPAERGKAIDPESIYHVIETFVK